MENVFKIKEILYALYLLSNYIRLKRRQSIIVDLINQIISQLTILDRTIVTELDYIINRMHFLRYAIITKRRRYVLLNIISEIIVMLYKHTRNSL